MDKRQIDRLLVGMQAGSNDDFAELYSGTKRGVFSFLYSYYHNYELTEDAMQSVYLRIKLNIGKYIPGTNGRAWILEIAKNYALNDLKRLKRIDTDAVVEIKSSPSELVGVIDVIKRTLTEEEERIVVLHAVWGYKHREIAAALGVPVGTVTSKYKRAVEKLRKELGDE